MLVPEAGSMADEDPLSAFALRIVFSMNSEYTAFPYPDTSDPEEE
jgi:hypothetical protein